MRKEGSADRYPGLHIGALCVGLLAMLVMYLLMPSEVQEKNTLPKQQVTTPVKTEQPVVPVVVTPTPVVEDIAPPIIAAGNEVNVRFVKQETAPTMLFGQASLEALGEKLLWYDIVFPEQEKGELAYVSSSDPERLFKRIQLLLESSSNEGDTVNETSLYGHPSFYYNILDKGENVRIVLQVESGIYVFSYPRLMHTTIKEILQNI